MGNRKPMTIMISCVTKDIFAITQPAIVNKVDKQYLLYYANEKRYRDEIHCQRTEIYDWLYSNVEDILRENLPDIDIVKVPCDTVNIDSVVKEVYSILMNEVADSTFYVNISGSTPEYSAGSVVAIMMESSLNPGREVAKNIRIISTGVKTSSETVESLRKYIGMELGVDPSFEGPIDRELVRRKSQLTHTFYSEPIPKTPDILMIYALKTYRDNITRTNDVIIEHLMEEGLWTPVERDRTVRDDRKAISKQRVQFRNLYLRRWLELDWIKATPNNNKRYVITSKGERLIEMFCCTDRIPDEFACDVR